MECAYKNLGCAHAAGCIKSSQESLDCGYYRYFYFLDHEFTGKCHAPDAMKPTEIKEIKCEEQL